MIIHHTRQTIFALKTIKQFNFPTSQVFAALSTVGTPLGEKKTTFLGEKK